MNDDPTDGSGLDQDAHIRALLAELGSGPDGETMPPEVTARLDDTLARLVAERGTAAADDESGAEELDNNVVPLRRRWLPRATAAAAAVIVLGAGGVAAANLGVFSSKDATSAGGRASDSKASESAPTTDAPSEEALGGATASGKLPELGARTFAADVAALVQRRASLVTPDEVPGPAAGSAEKSPHRLGNHDKAQQAPSDVLRSTACPGPKITDGAVPNPVRYDGQRAVLVVHPERDGRQLVQAWDCSGKRLLAGTSITP
jgi:hypothetical protein